MKSGDGTWVARAYDDEQRKYQLRALGSFAHHASRDRFTLAKQAAEVFASDVERGGIPEEKLETVTDACRRFAESRSDDKTGSWRRIVVPKSAAELFARSAEGKPTDAPLFTRADGSAWDKNSWKIPIASAVRAAKLPSNATAYTLRHSTITDLLKAGLALLTIAQISGTSVQMIEKHYGHLESGAAVEALSSLEL